MKKILLLTGLLSCFSLRSIAADATIANAPGGAITTVQDTYKMPWEDPAVQGYDITFLNLTNQILKGIASTNWVGANYQPIGGGGTATNLTGGATNQVYTQTGWSGNPTVSNLTVTGNASGGSSSISAFAYANGTGMELYGTVANALTRTVSTAGTGRKINLDGIDSVPNYGMIWGYDAAIRWTSVNHAGGDSGNGGNTIAMAMCTSAGTLILSNNVIVPGSLVASNGVINYGTGWAGTTNATAPSSAITPVAWVNYTNTTGGVFKMPLYQ